MSVLTLPLGPIQTNCYLVADGEAREAVAIDPGDEARKVLGAVRQNGWELKGVWLTHAHFDHIGAVGEIVKATGAPLAIHPDEVPLLRLRGGAMLFGLDIPPAPEPDVLLKPGQTLDVGGLRFEVLFVPGHTPGHVAFYCSQLKAVFSGDVLFQDSIGRTDLPGGDYARLMHSIKAVLLQLPDETTVYSGHGPATTLGAERRGNPFLAD
jgi:glyoxylase-like metal-dependent hydrolase (beta-lactamase superfamily II)